jgi:SAM-dependent methyltransferase
MAAPTTSYDTVLYPNSAHSQTHPARTAATARLHGVPAASPARCRVLEVGGGAGGNLVPMAYAYPDSEFVGVDLATTPVTRGNADIAALGLKNVRIVAADVRAIGEEYGTFDYVIAHGLFSWVPEAARAAILDLCRRVLAPSGVAYISYNALPGGLFRQVMWDFAKYHTTGLDDPAEKIRQAREAYRFLAGGVMGKGPLRDHFREEPARIAEDALDALVFHDDLSGENRQYYFHEFVALAGRYGLTFLAEALFADMVNEVYPPAVAARLDELGRADTIREEQYRDFLQLRRFRQTLLVRAGVPVSRPPTSDRLRGLWLALETRPDDPNPDLSPGVTARFHIKTGAALSTDLPLAKAALHVLSRRCPHPVRYDDLMATAARLLGRPAGAADDRELRAATDILLAAYRVGLAFAFVDPPKPADAAGERPRLSPVIRRQIETGSENLTSVLHTVVRIDDPVARRLLWLMDGTRDRAAVTADLAAWAAEEAAKTDGPTPSAEELREKFAARIDSGFAKAAELALLVE